MYLNALVSKKLGLISTFFNLDFLFISFREPINKKVKSKTLSPRVLMEAYADMIVRHPKTVLVKILLISDLPQKFISLEIE